MNNNNPDSTWVTEQRLLEAVATQRELFEGKLGRIEGALESKILHLTQMLQWVAIMAIALSVLVAVGGMFVAFSIGSQNERVIIEQSLPGSGVRQQEPLQ